MQCYTEILPPSGVTHALSLPFTTSTAKNLAVVKTSLLQLYDLVTVALEPESRPSQGSESARLNLIAEYELSGTVTDISRVKILNSKSGGEALLLAFRDAKLSLIEWDPQRNGISTVSIHYYEKEDVTRSPWAPDLGTCDSHLTVDPSSRCAILNFGLRNLAIVPFHQPGDDLVMDDYDIELDGQIDEEMRNAEQSERKNETKDSVHYQTPYAASFVLPLKALDPALLHPISLGFLHEYREPTFGILYSQIATSSALIHERKDIVYYSLFTLDLEQRASTTLLSVSKLPSDLFKVVALPPPVGGALLIGCNELIHVDQSGKTNATGVNEFARQVSSFPMVDQSDLALRLEGCAVEHLGNGTGDMILILSNGESRLVRLKLDGRSVSGVTVHPVSRSEDGQVMKAAASCSTTFGSGQLFFGSEDADSILLDWQDPSASVKKGREQFEDFSGQELEEEDDDNDIYEDDIYSDAPKAQSDHQISISNTVQTPYNLRVVDKLTNLGPLRDITLGKASPRETESAQPREDTTASMELVASYGSNNSGGVVILNREIDPRVVSSFHVENADSVWAVNVGNTRLNSLSKDDLPVWGATESYVIVARSKSSEKEESLVYVAKGKTLEPFRAPDVNPNEDCTVDVGSLASGTRVVQVLKGEVRIYESSKLLWKGFPDDHHVDFLDLALAQIYPVWDEDTSEERIAVSATFADPYLAILRDDSSLLLLQSDENGDLDEASVNEDISSQSWLSSCLYADVRGIFSESSSESNVLLFMLNAEYKLIVRHLVFNGFNSVKKVY